MLGEFGNIFLFLLHGIVFVFLSLLVARIIRPNRPSVEKLSSYECGEEPTGTARVQFNIRFYIIALMFLVFEVEVVLLFPWALVFQDLGWFAFWAMLVFVSLIFIGFIYELGSGNLEWDKPSPSEPKYVEGIGVVETPYKRLEQY